jgi:hypothetical protein
MRVISKQFLVGQESASYEMDFLTALSKLFVLCESSFTYL